MHKLPVAVFDVFKDFRVNDACSSGYCELAYSEEIFNGVTRPYSIINHPTLH